MCHFTLGSSNVCGSRPLLVFFISVFWDISLVVDLSSSNFPLHEIWSRAFLFPIFSSVIITTITTITYVTITYFLPVWLSRNQASSRRNHSIKHLKQRMKRKEISAGREAFPTSNKERKTPRAKARVSSSPQTKRNEPLNCIYVIYRELREIWATFSPRAVIKHIIQKNSTWNLSKTLSLGPIAAAAASRLARCLADWATRLLG
jgi:hypothetical protein